jgi:hypothetical protein
VRLGRNPHTVKRIRAVNTWRIVADKQASEAGIWSATSSSAWLAVLSGSRGLGNGTVGYSIERNRDLSEWITVTGGQSGSGSGVVSFTVSDNWDAPRHGVVMVRWPTPYRRAEPARGAGRLSYAVSTVAISIAAAGGASQFNVIQQSDPLECGGATEDRCLWTAQSDVSWITITTSMPQAGHNPVLCAGSTAKRQDGALGLADHMVRRRAQEE